MGWVWFRGITRKVQISILETLEHEINEKFAQGQEELKELRKEKGQAERSDFLTVDTQVVGKERGDDSIDCHA